MNAIQKMLKQAMKRAEETTVPCFQTELYSKLDRDIGVESFLSGFRRLKSNYERVNYLHTSLQKFNLVNDKFLADPKNDDKAMKYKEKGNNFFARKKFEKSLRYYTKTLMNARSKSLIAIAYANRSAALFKLKLFDECLTDINRALQNDYPDHLKPKLVHRKTRVLELKRVSENPPKFYEEPPKLPLNQRNPVVNCASNCIEVKMDGNSKRRIFATRDIAIGEVLCVETPYAAVIGETMLYHCHECFELCYNPIPCDRCTQVLYCGEECKNNAYAKYHRDECPILRSLRKMMGKYKSFLLGVKMAFLSKDESADEVFKLAADLEDEDKYYKDEMLQAAMMSAFVFDLVKKHTNRFDGPNNEQVEKVFKDSLLTFLRISVVQASGVDELCPEEDDDGDGEAQATVARALYPFYGLFSHSCCPNTFAHHHGMKRVLRAVRSIKKGQECCVSYGPYYAEHTKEERQHRLLTQYNYTCKCRACEENWPQLALQHYQPRFEDIEFLCEVTISDVDLAKRILPRKIKLMKNLERLEPNPDLTFQQKVLLHCFDMLGNKRVVL